MSCEKSTRTRVVKTSFVPRGKHRRNVNGYASELSKTDFAAETNQHLVVVSCVIFSSYLSVYHLARSFVVLLIVSSSRRSLLYPFALHWLQQFGKRSINNALLDNLNSFGRSRDKSVTQETLLITCNTFFPMFQP